MRILFVSNYEPWKLVSKGLMPSNHLFGIYEVLTDLRYDDRGGHGSFNGGIVDFVKVRRCSIRDIFKYYLKASKYDIVYDTINSISKYLGLIPKLLRPFKLVTILHHPPYDKQLKFADSDAYIFFSNGLFEIGRSACMRKTDKMFLNEWRPDYSYYREYFVGEKQQLYDFVDCGRTNRDHHSVVEAAIQTDSKCLFFDRRGVRAQSEYNIREGINTFFYKDDFIPDDTYISLIQNSKVMILALPESDKVYGPLGATVLMDALGLGIPIICSDNAYCSELVKQTGIGLIYHAGDVASLAKCMELLKQESLYNQCKDNLKAYNKSIGSGMQDYSVKVMEIIKHVLS